MVPIGDWVLSSPRLPDSVARGHQKRGMMAYATTMLDDPLVDELRADFAGSLIGPNDAEYESARRVHNGMIDKHPSLIARCTGVADVRAALDFGRRNGLPIAVRGGGHNVGGKAVCDDGIVIDLSPMKGVHVDPVRRTARAEPGLTWRKFDRETQAFGLATTGGAISTTGIAGLTLGGGIGYLMRKHGLTCDNLLSADVIDADGRLLTAGASENDELFWGLRGGGGNFGIVTSFEYRLHPLGVLLSGPVFHPFEEAREVFRFHREFSREAPDELFAEFILGRLPDGQPAVVHFLTYAGPPEEGEEVLRPAREFGRPLEDAIAPISYCDLQQAFDADFPAGLHNYWKSSNLRELSDEAIDTMVEFFDRVPSARSMVVIDPFGGAVGRVPHDATAFSHRDAEYDLIIASIWSDPAESEGQIQWARDFFEAMQPFSDDAVYVNYLGDEGDDRVRAAYGEHYERLAALKAKYDPENVFSNNQNIAPAV